MINWHAEKSVASSDNCLWLLAQSQMFGLLTLKYGEMCAGLVVFHVPTRKSNMESPDC